MQKANLVDTLFSFQGRISRKTFWLVGFSTTLVLSILSQALLNLKTPPGYIGGGPLLVVLVVISIALVVKGWHDLDKSGWWYLASLAPLLNIYAQVMDGFVKGTPGENRFGPDPRQ